MGARVVTTMLFWGTSEVPHEASPSSVILRADVEK